MRRCQAAHPPGMLPARRRRRRRASPATCGPSAAALRAVSATGCTGDAPVVGGKESLGAQQRVAERAPPRVAPAPPAQAPSQQGRDASYVADQGYQYLKPHMRPCAVEDGKVGNLARSSKGDGGRAEGRGRADRREAVAQRLLPPLHLLHALRATGALAIEQRTSAMARPLQSLLARSADSALSN